MRILQYMGPGKVELHERPVPELKAGEVLVKVEGVATCPHWDLHLMRGEPMFPGRDFVYPYMPGQPGHEAAGEIVKVGQDVKDLREGMRVCMWRDPGHTRWGCYAEYVAAAENVIEVGRELPLEKVVSLELGMCVQVSFDQLMQVMDLEGKRVAIGGLGPSGLVAVQLARAYGAAEVVGIDPVPGRRALAEQLGADRTMEPGSKELPSDRRAKGAFDAAVDCTGLPASIQALMDRTKRVVAIFGVLRDEVRFGAQHWGGLILMGYVPHNQGAAERALKCIQRGQLNLEPLISAKLPLTRYEEGIALLREKQAVKICFLPGQ